MIIEPYAQEVTDEIMSLLLIADPNQQVVRSYINNAKILVARDDEIIVGIGVLASENSSSEIKNLSILEGYRGIGIGKRLVTELANLARLNGANILEVGTGNSSLPQLAFYQKCGFRVHRIEIGYFDSYPEPIIENGIQCRDLVCLQIKL